MRRDVLPPEHGNASYLGFDFGERNIGVAIGQRITGTATALETIRATSDEALWSAVSRLVKTWQPSAFVVGMPYHPEEGEENPIVQPILRFCRQLEERFHRPVAGRHLAEQLRQFRERAFAVHEISGMNHAGFYELQRAADRAGHVVKARQQCAEAGRE